MTRGFQSVAGAARDQMDARNKKIAVHPRIIKIQVAYTAKAAAMPVTQTARVIKAAMKKIEEHNKNRHNKKPPFWRLFIMF